VAAALSSHTVVIAEPINDAPAAAPDVIFLDLNLPDSPITPTKHGVRCRNNIETKDDPWAIVPELGERIRQRIRDSGPLRFRDWMNACLYDPDGGYYMGPGRKTGAGDDADFATAPTLHPFMAESVAKEAQDTWNLLGQPKDFTVVEFGGGEGDLARDALTWLDVNAKDFAANVSWIHVEISPAHQNLRKDGDPRIRHEETMPSKFKGMVLAHEFIDALPFNLLEWRKANWAEVHIGLDEQDQFREILGWPSRSAVEAAPKRAFEDGQRIIAMAEAQSWMADVVHALGNGRILIIDYGDTGKRLWVQGRQDASVRGFRGQQMVDPLHEPPGSCDITTNVDFTQLGQWATFDGFRPDLESQEAFLLRHGALETMATAPRNTVEEASAYLRLKQLVLPQAMGTAFKVMRLDRGLKFDS
jgi:SAM-dependent MidA family methyltransferase